MTISSTLRKAGPFAGNGVATSFTFSFKVFAASDLVVTLLNISTAVETVLTLNSDYTVTLNADQNTNPGGTVTYNPSGVPMASTHTLTLTSDVPQSQGTDIPNAGGFYPEAIENALDKATVLIQQLSEIVGRAFRLPVSSSGNPTLPAPQGGSGFGWNATGTAIINYVFSTGTTLVDLAASGGSALIGFIQGGAGAVARTVQDKLREIISVSDFLTFSNALTYAANKTLYVKAGETVAIAADTSIPSTVSLVVEKGGLITVATGKTLTIAGPFRAGLYQAFSCSGTGVVSFGKDADACNIDVVFPEWWGAVADNVADCSVAINKAIASLPTFTVATNYDAFPAGGTVQFSRGSYRIEHSVIADKLIHLRGMGRFVSSINVPADFSDAMMIHFAADAGFSTFSHLRLHALGNGGITSDFIRITDARSVGIFKNMIDLDTGNGLAPDFCKAIHIINATVAYVGFTTIHDNYITGMQWGVYMDGRNITTGTVYNNDFVGLQDGAGGAYSEDAIFGSSDVGSGGDWRIWGNEIEGWKHGIQIRNAGGVLITGNHYETCPLGTVLLGTNTYNCVVANENYSTYPSAFAYGPVVVDNGTGNQIWRGLHTGSFGMTAAATETVVMDPIITPFSKVLLTPRTASAVAAAAYLDSMQYGFGWDHDTRVLYNETPTTHAYWAKIVTTQGVTKNATALDVTDNGLSFVIVASGTTDFTLLGAANSNVGTVFTWNNVAASGTGTCARYTNWPSITEGGVNPGTVGTVFQYKLTDPAIQYLSGTVQTGCFIVKHGAAAGTETFDYVVMN